MLLSKPDMHVWEHAFVSTRISRLSFLILHFGPIGHLTLSFYLSPSLRESKQNNQQNLSAVINPQGSSFPSISLNLLIYKYVF